VPPIVHTEAAADQVVNLNTGRPWTLTVVALSFGLALALAAIVVLVMALNSAKTQKATGGTASSAIRAFWSPFATNAPLPG
jgi:hypothetical protein